MLGLPPELWCVLHVKNLGCNLTVLEKVKLNTFIGLAGVTERRQIHWLVIKWIYRNKIDRNFFSLATRLLSTSTTICMYSLFLVLRETLSAFVVLSATTSARELHYCLQKCTSYSGSLRNSLLHSTIPSAVATSQP